MPPCEEIDSEEDNVVMEVLGALEDMLYESVTFGGDHDDEEEVWNSCESKEGGNLREEIEAFEARAIDAVDSAEWETDEYPLKLTGLHGDFRELVEGQHLFCCKD